MHWHHSSAVTSLSSTNCMWNRQTTRWTVKKQQFILQIDRTHGATLTLAVVENIQKLRTIFTWFPCMLFPGTKRRVRTSWILSSGAASGGVWLCHRRWPCCEPSLPNAVTARSRSGRVPKRQDDCCIWAGDSTRCLCCEFCFVCLFVCLFVHLMVSLLLIWN